MVTKYMIELKGVYDYLQNHTSSRGMIQRATGYAHKDITKYIRELGRKGLLQRVEKRTCERSGSQAWYFTSNRTMFPEAGKMPKLNTIIGMCLEGSNDNNEVTTNEFGAHGRCIKENLLLFKN